MTIMFEGAIDPQLEWLYHIGPVGLVIGPNVIREEDLTPARQTAVDTLSVAELLTTDTEDPALPDPWLFFERILGWEARYVAGAPGGPSLPENIASYISEHEVLLSPDWAVRDLGGADPGAFQILVKLHTTLDADKRGVLDRWDATPHHQFERLLRESGVTIGVLVDRSHLWLIYAPRGETSGWLYFPLRSLGTVAGRAMLGGLKLILGHARLFTEPEGRRLPKLLARSREAQNKVSAQLAEQVLGALHELLRAFHAADPERIEQLAATRPHHLYEGLLTTLMRLVFLLYAEDRELMPTQRVGEAVDIYESSYSVRGLYARLIEDRALNPDTMDERVGGWGRLLALFRLVHGGHPSGWITARGGKLFDTNVFPFLESRNEGEPRAAAKVLPIRDGAVLRILEGLMTVEARSFTGERVRERLSYRSLDVEQIGSVYETIMGFTIQRASGPMIAVKGEKNLPVFVDILFLGQKKAPDRQKLLKEWGVSPTGRKLEAIKNAKDAGTLTEALAAISDPRGSPGGHVVQAGSPILQPTDERRQSGSHYTPRTLTEPIVRYALEPAFERIGEDATPDQVLDIKVCDPACGSGAFLVEACRQIGERLEKAWGKNKDLKPAIPPDEDEALHACRLVAQRSLYGVDKNPLAVDLARLSLWLATLAREHEFTFLDHAVKSGNSLIGLTREQIEAAHWDLSKDSAPLLRGLLRERVNEVAIGRRDIQFASDDVTRAIQEARHRIVEKKLEGPRLYGDAVVAAFFSADKPRKREEKRVEVAKLLTGLSSETDRTERLATVAATLTQGAHPIRPFHWELEFPEVFTRDNPGFDAIVGNPPFAGKNTTTTSNRDGFLDWLKVLHAGTHGNSDLVAHFFRRTFGLIRQRGACGLIATNTVGQGDTRTTGLTAILAAGGRISRAVKRLQWPGEAAVVVSVIHITKSNKGEATLNGKNVRRVSAFLVEGDFDTNPALLKKNSRTAFQGTNPVGAGFLFDDARAKKGETLSLRDMNEILTNDATLSEFVKPYTSGEDVANDVHQMHRRYVIDFGDLNLEDAERRGGALFSAVNRLVKPVRDTDNREHRRQNWWKHGEPQKGLYIAIEGLPLVLVAPQTSPHLQMALRTNQGIFASTVIAFSFSNFSSFALLQSRIHEVWARFFSSSMKDDLRYAPSDCFETFPFPSELKDLSDLESAGMAYHSHRATLMIARNEGTTRIYNRFHDATEGSSDVQHLRELHAKMDRTTLRAYGWHDLAEQAQPVFLNEQTEDDHAYQGRLFWSSGFRDEVLARLLALNVERHTEEVRLGLVSANGALIANDSEDGEEYEAE
ncbi:hypothetical protein V1286_006101 [Bradyrhizobium algeriense]|uniref:site-specific DNA-methyltransferase (adenine-specific) n=1 Tax=Bradyrhizobium algeriense TaxID=634784 RepID=A0ABU8BJ45_9BRAD